MNVSYSYVCPRPEQVLNTKLSKERNDIASMRIKGIANAFNIKLIEENNNNTDDEKKNMTAMMISMKQPREDEILASPPAHC